MQISTEGYNMTGSTKKQLFDPEERENRKVAESIEGEGSTALCIP